MTETDTQEKQDLTAQHPDAQTSAVGRLMGFCLSNPVIVAMLLIVTVAFGLMVAPFDWELGFLPRDPVPVDAIPDIGENQQIVFTEWMGRSPEDVEDQITYPLTVALMGIPRVEEVRSFSYFGFSQIYVVFEDGVDFYWSRSRVIEKLDSLPPGDLPAEVEPTLGPDATALGQIFWYTLQGRDPGGNPAGGWDLDELRTVQDWYVRYYLLGARGIAEVASIGGFQKEYQVDIDPDAMRAHGVSVDEVSRAVRRSNLDVGARNLEINRVEYLIRSRGFIEDQRDIAQTVIKVNDNVPLRVEDVAEVTTGPAQRRGALDINGSEAVGGVVTVRDGFNPLEAIHNVKEVIGDIGPGLPRRPVIDYARVSRQDVAAFAARAGFRAYTGAELNEDPWLQWLDETSAEDWPDWITTSQLEIVPFYDRTDLIYETLGTLGTALSEEILVTIIVIIVLLRHLASSLLVSSVPPLAVLMCFIIMKLAGVDANIVSLSGIAISIGAIVDMSIIVSENVFRHLEAAAPGEDKKRVVLRGASEVGSAVLTAVATTVLSFMAVFTMTGPEGRLFRPLAFTFTSMLVASIIIALTVMPVAGYLVFTRRFQSAIVRRIFLGGLAAAGVVLTLGMGWYIAGPALFLAAACWLGREHLQGFAREMLSWVPHLIAVVAMLVILARYWEPLGPEAGLHGNLVFLLLTIGGLLGTFELLRRFYCPLLGWCLRHKAAFLSLPVLVVFLGAMAWQGFEGIFSFVPTTLGLVGIDETEARHTTLWMEADARFPGLGREFMPALDEGSFLWMPTTSPHASIGEAIEVMAKQDRAFSAIPEVDTVVGKIGRAESPLDPAPISMIETLILYHSEYKTDADGRRLNFQYDRRREEFLRDEAGELIPDPGGRPYRQWRDHIRTPDDIWDEIVEAGRMLGTTSAPKLQPIETRLVMLQTGMRAPMGVKVFGPDLESLEQVAIDIEEQLREVPVVQPATVRADRVVGKPYVVIDLDREALSRHGISIEDAQMILEVAVGGMQLTRTVEGRERFGVRVRYQRELRDDLEKLGRILLPALGGSQQIPLEQVADIRYERGPMVIKSEDTFLVAYVTFGMQPGHAEVEVVQRARDHLDRAVEEGRLSIPDGVTYRFAGAYEQQVRAQRTLAIILPISLFLIFIILYLQFKSTRVSLLVFASILLAWSGGFLLLWLYGEPWFMNFSLFGTNLRDLFNMQTFNLSVAVWVGFLALFGIASDDGVVMTTYLKQLFERRQPDTLEAMHEVTIEAGSKRIRPCLMTGATTILALLPVLTSTGRGADVMIPMAIPAVGGMTFVVLANFMVPVLYCLLRERELPRAPRSLMTRTKVALANALKFLFVVLATIILVTGLLVALSLHVGEPAAVAPPAEEEVVEEDPHRHH